MKNLSYYYHAAILCNDVTVFIPVENIWGNDSQAADGKGILPLQPA